MSRPARGLALLVAQLCGCTLFQSGPDVHLGVTILSPTPTRADVITISVSSDVSSPVTLVLDGWSLGEVPVDTLLDLHVGSLPEGTYHLVARVDDGPQRIESSEAIFVLDRSPPRLQTALPVPGQVGPDPLVVKLIFSEPVQVLDVQAVGIAAPTTSLSADRRTATLRSGTLQGQASLHIQVEDDAHNAASFDVGPWTAGDFSIDVLDPPALGWVRGVVPVRVDWTGPVSLDVGIGKWDLDHGGLTSVVPLGTLVHGSSLSLDTRLFADGGYALQFTAAGWLPRYWSVAIDNTPPVVACEPRPHRADDARVGDAVWLSVTDNQSLRDGVWQDAWVLAPAFTPPSLPWSLVLAVPDVQDQAGNVQPAHACTIDFPVWRSPMGSGSIRPTGQVGPDHVLLGLEPDESQFYFGPTWSTFYIEDVYFITWAGEWAWETLAGQYAVSDVESRGDGEWALVSYALFVGRGTAQPESVAGLLELEPGGDWTKVTISDVTSDGAVAWRVDTGTRHTLGVAWRGASGWSRFTVENDPAGDCTGASVTADRVAFAEAAAGGPAQLFEQRLAGTSLGSVAGPLNADPFAAASEPAAASTAASDAVAWVEARQVHARIAPAGGAYGAPEVLNEDPAEPARLPRLSTSASGPVAVFVEATPSGERIEARRYRESTSAWESLASLDAPDPVERLEVSWPYVYWTDAAGSWYLRAFDE